MSDDMGYEHFQATLERDTESYVAEAKYYYDNALILIDNNSYAFHDIDKQAVALDRAKDYIGWLLAYVDELKGKVSYLVNDDGGFDD